MLYRTAIRLLLFARTASALSLGGDESWCVAIVTHGARADHVRHHMLPRLTRFGSPQDQLVIVTDDADVCSEPWPGATCRLVGGAIEAHATCHKNRLKNAVRMSYAEGLVSCPMNKTSHVLVLEDDLEVACDYRSRFAPQATDEPLHNFYNPTPFGDDVFTATKKSPFKCCSQALLYRQDFARTVSTRLGTPRECTHKNTDQVLDKIFVDNGVLPVLMFPNLFQHSPNFSISKNLPHRSTSFSRGEC